MTWKIVPIRLTYYRPKWRLFILCLAILMMICLLLHIRSDLMISCPACKSARTLPRNNVVMDFDFGKYQNMTWETRDEDIPLLTIFTTWNPSMQKPIVYKNSITNWRSLTSGVRTIVFTNDSEITRIAKHEKVDVMPITRTACFGTPVLRTMFEEVMRLPQRTKLYAYSNADIIFNDGLVKTLTEITKSRHFKDGPILIVGKRIDVNISMFNDPKINTTKDVDILAKYGNLSWGFAADFFFTNELFPWEYVPDLVIGRALIDNWLIWYARRVGAKVIDVTGTVIAVHQLANGLKRIQCNCNKAEMWKSKLLPILPLWRGMIECAAYEAKYNSNGDVLILPKLLLQQICKLGKT